MTKKSKVYLELYYGRLSMDSEPMETDGSILIGPFDCFITTYVFTIRMLYKNNSYTIPMQEDMIVVDNIYYSDWAICAGLPDWYAKSPIPTYNFPEAIKKGFIQEF